MTRHVVREGGVLRDYVLLFGHLDRAGDDVRRGRRLHDGDIVGFVGNSASPRLVHLHLEARRVRDGIDPWRLYGEGLRERESSIVTDPRNVLPLRSPRAALAAVRAEDLDAAPRLLARKCDGPDGNSWCEPRRLTAALVSTAAGGQEQPEADRRPRGFLAPRLSSTNADAAAGSAPIAHRTLA